MLWESSITLLVSSVVGSAFGGGCFFVEVELRSFPLPVMSSLACASGHVSCLHRSPRTCSGFPKFRQSDVLGCQGLLGKVSQNDSREVRCQKMQEQMCTAWARHSSGDHSSRVVREHAARTVDLQPVGGVGYGNAAAVVEQSRKRTIPMIISSEEASSRPLQFRKPQTDLASQKSSVAPGRPSASPKQLCVAVDVDEVLGSFLSTLNVFIAEEYFLHHDVSEYYTYDFMKIWNCSQAEANHRVHAFFESEHFNNGILPIPGAYQTLMQLAEHCNLVVVTSRQHVIQDRTLEWIERYYGGIFTEVHFGNHFALEGSSRPKSEICRSLGAQILIDDNPKYAMDCAESGIEVLLFDLYGQYPWSKTPEGPCHPLITRVRDWQEVEQALLSRTWARFQ